MSFYRGYLVTRHKKSIETFKNRVDFKTYDQVKNLPEFAGLLAEDVILIDVDDFESSEILLRIVKSRAIRCRVYKTSRGKHFLFKNDKVDTNKGNAKLAITLNSDIKVGSRNSYQVLKNDGVLREILLNTAYDDVDYIPKWLTPVSSNYDFKDMNEGEGRNQELYNYILTLQSNDFEIEEIRETIRIINEYVLKEPLSESEIETILRDEAFEKPTFFKGKSFEHDRFAVFLRKNHHIKRINGQLHIYKNGLYVPGYRDIESVMITHIPNLTRARRQEVLAYLEILVNDDSDPASANLIAFRNGVYNIEDDSFMDLRPGHVMTNMINWDYNPAAYFEDTNTVLNNISCNAKEIRMLLEEMIGYCMYRRNELGKAFILTGDGSNGKSTFLNMLKNMLGENNTSVLDLKKLADRFSTVMLFGKLANIGDDISDEYLTDTAEFKKIVTGETIDAEQKGQPKFEFKPYVKLLFSANNIPRIGRGRDSSAILRRLVIVPFNARFTKDTMGNKFNFKIGDGLNSQESMEYLITLGLKGLKRVLENQEFTTSTMMQKELEEFEETNNPVLGFFRDTDKEDIINEATRDVYRQYTTYCNENSLQAMSSGEFSKQVKKFYGVTIVNKRINGKLCKAFKHNELDDTK